MKTKTGRQQGFTAIELVMIIVILGILAAIAIPRFIDFTGNAQQEETSNIANALSSSSTKNYLTCHAADHQSTPEKCIQIKKCSDILATIKPALVLGTAGVPIDNTYNLVEDKTLSDSEASTTCTLQYLLNGVTYSAPFTVHNSK